MNPYEASVQPISRSLRSWQALLPPSLNLRGQPLARSRLLLAACALETAPPMLNDAESQRQAALIRRVERQLRLRFLSLMPHEGVCEHLLTALFMLSALTCAAARREQSAEVRGVLDFLLPENCDMLYRTANLLSLEYGVSAGEVLGNQTELMPGRPCIAAHRHPYDDVRPPLKGIESSASSFVSLYLLHAAARSVSRMAANALQAENPRARALYAELSLILSEHAAQYGGLLGCGRAPDLELLLRAYAHCSLFSDLASQEENADLLPIWREAYSACCAHLQKARELYRRRRPARPVPFEGEALPPPLLLRADKGYIRGAMNSVGLTVRRGRRLPVGMLPADADFFRYQQQMNDDPLRVPSHAVVAAHILKTGRDFRLELAPHPIEMLRNRAADPVSVGR